MIKLTVKLEYYQIDETSGMKVKLNDTLSFGNMFKGTQKKIPITIFNSGDTTAVSPVVSIAQYPLGNYVDCFKWKKISFDKEKNYSISLKLPDIQPKSWLIGKEVQFEDFNSYPTIAGTRPDQAWLLWKGTDFAWEVIASYIK